MVLGDIVQHLVVNKLTGSKKNLHVKIMFQDQKDVNWLLN